MENPFKSRPHFLEIFGQDSVCVCVCRCDENHILLEKWKRLQAQFPDSAGCLSFARCYQGEITIQNIWLGMIREFVQFQNTTQIQTDLNQSIRNSSIELAVAKVALQVLIDLQRTAVSGRFDHIIRWDYWDLWDLTLKVWAELIQFYTT